MKGLVVLLVVLTAAAGSSTSATVSAGLAPPALSKRMASRPVPVCGPAWYSWVS